MKSQIFQGALKKDLSFSLLQEITGHHITVVLLQDRHVPTVILDQLVIEINHLFFKWRVMLFCLVWHRKAQHGGGRSRAAAVAPWLGAQLVRAARCVSFWGHTTSLPVHLPGVCPSILQSTAVLPRSEQLPFSIQKKRQYLQANPMPPTGPPCFHPPQLQATELASAAASRGREIPVRRLLLGALREELPTKYRHSAQEEEDFWSYEPQEQRCVFSGAIYWYLTWERLTRVQTSCILASGRVRF